MKKKSFSFGLMEVGKWASFLLIIVLIVKCVQQGKVSSVDFNSASNDVVAALDTSVMTKGNSGTLKQLYNLDSGNYQGFLLYISSANAEKVGLTSDQETAPIGVNENGVAEQNSLWAAEPIGTEEFLMIRLDSPSQAREVEKAIKARVNTMKEELKKASPSSSASSESAASSTAESESTVSSSAESVAESTAASTAADSNSTSSSTAVADIAGSAVNESTSSGISSSAASSLESVLSSSSGEAPADAASLLDNCIIDTAGNYILFVSAPNAEEVDQLFRKSI